MPQVAVAVAAWVGSTITVALGSSAAAAAVGGAAANFIAAAGFAQGFAAAASAWATIAAIGSVARGKPRIGGSVGTQVDFKADLNAGVPYPMGQTGVGGNIIFADTAEGKNQHLLYLTVLSGAGPIEEITSFEVNDVATSFSADNAVGPYHNFMWSRWQLGSQTPTAFDPPATTLGAFPEWTSAHKLTGYAAHWWVLEYDPKVYPSGTPKPLTVVKGVKVYDPRKDSTYPGGSGAHRSNSEATWEYSENPFLHALTWCIGRFQNGRKLMGVGAAIAMIDVAAFVEGANVCDANAWKLGGAVYSTDDKWEALGAMLAAGGGWPTALGAKISCGVNAPKVSLATLTGADSCGEVTITAAKSSRDRLNGVTPRYREAAHSYEVVPAAKITIASYLAADGGEDLSKEIDFPLCPAVNQAAQLGVYAVSNSREFGPIVIPCKPRWRGYKANDAITVDEPEWGLSGQLCLILARQRDPASGIVTLTLQTETTGKHAPALAQTGVAPPTPSLTGFDATNIAPPGAGAFAIAGATLTAASGQIPAVVLTGASDNQHADALLIQYRQSGAGTWNDAPPVKLPTPGTTIRVEITGVNDSKAYDVQTAYRSPRGVVSAWTSEGTATAGAFTLAVYDAAVSDGVLTPAEKLTIVPGLVALQNARTALRAAADAAGLTVASGNTDRANYEAAASNLDAYLATLTAPVAWNNTTGNTTIAAPATFRTRYQDAHAYETALQTAIDAAQKGLIDNALSDGVLTPAEKRDFIPRVKALIDGRTNLRAAAVALNLTIGTSAARANYEAAATALDSYLATLTAPVMWDNSAGNTTIAAPATFKTRLEDADHYETDLQAAIDAIHSGRTQYQATDGTSYDYRGQLFGYSVAGVAGRGLQPLSTAVGEIDVAAHDVTLPGMTGNVILHIPAHAETGLLNDHDYVMFYRPDFGDWFPVQAEFAAAFYTSRDGYLWLGNVHTPTSGGVWTSPASHYTTTGVYESFTCVSAQAFLASGKRVGEAMAGDALTLMAPHGCGLESGVVRRIDLAEARLLRIRTERGAVLTVSDTAPLMTRKGPGYLPRAVMASAAAAGLPVPILDAGELVWDRIAEIAPAGRGPVGQISADGGVYAAADDPAGPFLLTHNAYSKNPP